MLNRIDYKDSYTFKDLLLIVVKKRQGSSAKGIYNTMTLTLFFPNRDDIATPKIWPITGGDKEG